MGSGSQVEGMVLYPSLIHKKELNNRSKQYTVLGAKVQEFLVAKKEKCKEEGTCRSGRKQLPGEGET